MRLLWTRSTRCLLQEAIEALRRQNEISTNTVTICEKTESVCVWTEKQCSGREEEWRHQHTQWRHIFSLFSFKCLDEDARVTGPSKSVGLLALARRSAELAAAVFEWAGAVPACGMRLVDMREFSRSISADVTCGGAPRCRRTLTRRSRSAREIGRGDAESAETKHSQLKYSSF